MTHSSLLKIASLGLLAINLSACSSSSWLKNINVSIQNQGNDQMVQVAADLQTGGISLAGLQVPIYAKNGTEIGSVSLATPSNGSGTQLALDFDLTTALGLQDVSHDATLPNGTAIPVSNINSANLMTFPIGSAGSKAYVLYDSVAKQAMIGLALVINGLNTGLTGNLLLPFQIGNLSGSVGPFSGAASGQSGLALFVNASSLVPSIVAPSANPDDSNIVHIMAARSATADASSGAAAAPATPMVFKISTSAKTDAQKKIESHLADLSARHAKLSIQ